MRSVERLSQGTDQGLAQNWKKLEIICGGDFSAKTRIFFGCPKKNPKKLRKS